MYDDAVTGVVERLQSVSALKAVLKYVPATIQAAPLAWVIYDSHKRRSSGPTTIVNYRLRVTVALSWQDTEQSEGELIPLINEVPAAIDQDPQLGGRVTEGVATQPDATGGWYTIGGVTYRTIDFYVEVPEAGAYQSGI